MSTIQKRESAFLAQLVLSESSLRNYKVALNSTLLKDSLQRECGVSSLYELTDLEILWKLYCVLNHHPTNIAAHRIYSAAVMKYIRFLNNGKKYGKRVDFMKQKKTRQSVTDE